MVKSGDAGQAAPVWQTRDPDGRLVLLTFARWQHVLEDHPELADARGAILAVVAEPAAHVRGRDYNEEWFYGQGFGPSRFVRVVVHFRNEVGTVTTAFPRRRFP